MNEQQENLLKDLLTEQKKTNEILMVMCQFMADNFDDEDAEPTHYLDGSPIVLGK